MARIDDLRKIATRLRIHCLRMTTAAGSAKASCAQLVSPGSSLSFSNRRALAITSRALL